MKNTVKERLDWFHRFMPLYERAAPLVRYIGDLESLKAGELPASPSRLIESSILLRPILHAVRKIPKSKEKELVTIQREFESALNSCIKAAEWAEKYLNCLNRGTGAQPQLAMLINSTVLAYEYIESVSARVAPYLERDNVSCQ